VDGISLSHDADSGQVVTVRDAGGQVPALVSSAIGANAVPSIEQIVQDFRLDCEDRHMTDESIRRYLSCLGMFLDFIRARGISSLEVDRQVLKSAARCN
jgi:hypothetical protein